jgi:transposase-like protein
MIIVDPKNGAISQSEKSECCRRGSKMKRRRFSDEFKAKMALEGIKPLRTANTSEAYK